MLEFIAKYWLEVFFGLICGGASFAIRHHLKLMRDQKEKHEKELVTALENTLKTKLDE